MLTFNRLDKPSTTASPDGPQASTGCIALAVASSSCKSFKYSGIRKPIFTPSIEEGHCRAIYKSAVPQVEVVYKLLHQQAFHQLPAEEDLMHLPESPVTQACHDCA